MKQKMRYRLDLEGRVRLLGNQGYIGHMHHHDELEVSLVTRGRAAFLLLDRRYELRRGVQTWMFPNQEHVIFDQSPDYEMWVCLFSPGLVRRVATGDRYRTLHEAEPPGNWCKRLPSVTVERLESLYTELRDCREDPARFNAGLAYALLTSWIAHIEAPEMAGRPIHPAVELAARMIKNETDALSLSELADRVHLSPARLSTLFKQQIGMPLAAYRQRHQLDRFLKLYSTGERPNLLDAAYEAGFGSYPQFYRVFKRLMGYGPARYRREIATRGADASPPRRQSRRAPSRAVEIG